MDPNQLRVRVVGSNENCERILSLLMDETKEWGKRKLIKWRLFKRDPKAKPYHRMFGTADTVIYVDMRIKERGPHA